MRLVTTVAKHPLGMRYSIDLVEALGLSGILFVAAPAKVGHIRKLGDIGGGVVSMPGQRSMTRFAGDLGMHATPVHLGLLIVALEALLMPGVGDRASADHFERARPVVPIFPKIFRHYDSPDEQEHRQPRKQYQCRANQVSGILE